MYLASIEGENFQALDSGLKITSAEWMASATEGDVDSVFKSDGGRSFLIYSNINMSF